MAVRVEYFQGALKGSPFYGRPRGLAEMQGGLLDRRLQSVELPAGWLVQCGGGWEGWSPWGCSCRGRLGSAGPRA